MLSWESQSYSGTHWALSNFTVQAVFEKKSAQTCLLSPEVDQGVSAGQGVQPTAVRGTATLATSRLSSFPPGNLNDISWGLREMGGHLGGVTAADSGHLGGAG